MHHTGHRDYRIARARLDDGPAIARLHVDGWRAAYRGVLPDAVLDSLSYAQREDLWRGVLADPGPRHVLVACEADGPIVGFAVGQRLPNRLSGYEAELQAVYVRDSHQRRGVGTGLFSAVGNELVSENVGSLMTWIFAQNPAVHFCARLGGQRFDERTIEVAGHPVEEVAFGWPDLAAALVPRAPE